MERIKSNNKIFKYFECSLEREFEKEIVQNSSDIFGENTIYIDIKKKIGSEIVTIPDGYLLDFTFNDNPKLYIIENEISSHDPYKHIGSQLLKFAISYKESGRKIKKFLAKNLLEDNTKLSFVESGAKEAGFRNMDEFLDHLIFEVPIAAIVIIDIASDELINVLNQLSMHTDIIEFQTFVHNSEKIHKFTPFNAEIRDISESQKHKIDAEKIDTIIVPAREDGFEEVFIGENRWYAIRMSAAMIDRIKYIVAYQTAPVSAITCYAEVSSIEKWMDTEKYVVNFKEKAKQIGPIKLESKKKGTAPQAPRYTTFERLIIAKNLSEVF